MTEQAESQLLPVSYFSSNNFFHLLRCESCKIDQSLLFHNFVEFFLLDTERRLAIKLAGFVPSCFIYTTASKSKMAYPKGLHATAPGLCVVNSWSENVYGRWMKVFERIIWNEVLICFLNLLHHANNMIVK